jgi:hypothetical protein
MEPFIPGELKDANNRLILDDRLNDIKQLDDIAYNLKMNLDQNAREIYAIDLKRKELVDQISHQKIAPPMEPPGLMWGTTQPPPPPVDGSPPPPPLSPQEAIDLRLVIIDNYIRHLPSLVDEENRVISVKKATEYALQNQINDLVGTYIDLSQNIQKDIVDQAKATVIYNTKTGILNTIDNGINNDMEILGITQSVSDNYYKMMRNIQDKMHILSNDTIHNLYDIFNAIHNQNNSIEKNIGKFDGSHIKNNQDSQYENEMLPFFDGFNKILLVFYFVLYLFLLYLILFVETKLSYIMISFIVVYIGLHPFFIIYWYKIHFPENLKFLNAT